MISLLHHSPIARHFGTSVIFLYSMGFTAQANLLTNGSFESPVVPAGGGQSFPVGSGAIPGWSVVGPSGLDVGIYNRSFTLPGYTFPAQDGAQWLDLTGVNSNNIEGVSQTVATVQGRTYTLTFWVGNASGGSLGIFSSVGLKINGNFAGNYMNSSPGTSFTWQKFSYSFVATAATTTIEFDNLDPDIGNALDNVDLEEGGTASPLPVNLLVNGDFETPAVAAGGVLNFSARSTDIQGWTVLGTVTSNTVAVVSGALVDSGFYGTAQNGHQWMDLAGSGYSTGTRGISQTVTTVPGMTYSLSFWVGSIYDTRTGSTTAQNFGPTSTVAVKVNDAPAGTFTNNAQPAGTSPLVAVQNWQQFSLTFTAMSASTTIEFDNMDPPTDTCNGLDNVVLQQVASAAPSISSGGVLSASAFGGFTAIAPGSWIEIYGNNFASGSRSWTGSDFSGLNAPTSLDGISVRIGGQAAFVDYISPVQVNALVPSNVSPGSQQITVTNPQGTSTAFNVTVNPAQPGLLAPSSFNIGGVQYAVAILSDGSYALPVGAIAGVKSRPARPGDVLTLYGVGFGPVTPASPAGQLVQQLNSLTLPLQMSIGGVPVSPSYFGLAPNYTGLYQFNVSVPSLSTGNATLSFNLGGTAGTQTLFLAVEN